MVSDEARIDAGGRRFSVKLSGKRFDDLLTVHDWTVAGCAGMVPGVDLGEVADSAAAGDRRAADVLVEATFADVWRFARSLVGPQRAEDAVQSTYLRAWRALPGQVPLRDPRRWLLAICWRTCADVLRSEQRYTRRIERWRERGPLESSRGAGEAVLEDSLLAALDPERRAAFVLTQLLGFSYSETAEICGVAVGTIRSRVARARTELAQAWRAASTGEGSGASGT